jgi:hypothetical protein
MRCKVSFTDSAGTEHAVEVEAESLYDAVGLAIARFQGAPSEMSELLKIRGYPSRNIEFDIAARLATLDYCAIKTRVDIHFRYLRLNDSASESIWLASFRRKIRFVENHCSGPRSRCPSH